MASNLNFSMFSLANFSATQQNPFIWKNTSLRTSAPPPNPLDHSQVTTWTITTLIFCLIGCILNCLIIYVSWPRAGEKSGVSLLIFHFILTNLGHCLIHVPVRCIMVQAKQAGYGATLEVCYFFQTFNSVNWLVTYWADASLAVNRCVALFLPHHYKRFTTMHKNVVQISAMWCVSLALILPYNFGVGGFLTILVSGHCAIRGNNASMYGNFYNVFKYAPFLINGVASVLILWKCYFSRRLRGQGERPGGEVAVGAVAAVAGPTVAQHRILLAKLLVLTYLWTISSLIPSNALIAIDPTLFERVPMVNLWLQTVIMMQYAFAPCILLASNPKYPERLRKLTRKVVPFAGTGRSHSNRRSTLRPSAFNSLSKTVDSNAIIQSNA